MKNYLIAACMAAMLSGQALWAETIVIEPDAAPRVEFGAEHLAAALRAVGKEATVSKNPADAGKPDAIVVGTYAKGAVAGLVSAGKITINADFKAKAKPQGFEIFTGTTGTAGTVAGTDDSGVLYGCFELSDRITAAKALPAHLDFADAPSMKMRGPCIAMQKASRLPGRGDYEYPYTPENFPFFYDKAQWISYLDMLAKNRMNTVYLWNGHPFASLVKVPGYEYAVEVPDDVFAKNQEMFKFLVDEADKRGIFVMQMFYNIYVSKTFAQKNGMRGDTLSASTPLVADYNRKSIAAFVKTYPQAGLMVCLGEALKGDAEQTNWLENVVIPGVKDGMALAGLKQEIPILVRAHSMPAEKIMPEAVKLYGNLYTETKYNGESLTSYVVRGDDMEKQQLLASLGSTHISNVHVLSNLEPFRYGAQRFIKKCVQAMETQYHANGIHLYPLTYWTWPYSPDKTSPDATMNTPDKLLHEVDRDWIWFEAWSRYAWNPYIDETVDHQFWVKQIGDMYGGDAAGEQILAAYNDSGECAPILLRRFGITEGNRQTLSLGMTLDQIDGSSRDARYPVLWESWAPEGERIHDTSRPTDSTPYFAEGYVTKEWKGEPHVGETPPVAIDEVLDFSKKAVDEIDRAAPLVTKNQEEFARLRNDIHCIREMTLNYTAKANAAMLVLRYNYSHDPQDMVKAQAFLEDSLVHFRKLTDLTKDHYLFANSLHTNHRSIPFASGGDPADGGPAPNTLWTQVLPKYETEYTEFQAKVRNILAHPPAAKNSPAGDASVPVVAQALKPAAFTLVSKNAEIYDVAPGAKVFTDSDAAIQTVAPELLGLKGIRISQKDPGKLELQADVPVQILVGYVQNNDKAWLKLPKYDEDSTATEVVSVTPSIMNAATISNTPKIDIHLVKFDKGRHVVDLHSADGAYVILGVIPADTKIDMHDAKGGK